MSNQKKLKLCMVSSSGGHYEQLRMLHPLGEHHQQFFVTEITAYASPADYYLRQTGLKDAMFPLKMLVNLFTSIRIWRNERPDVVITTGTMVALPLCFLAKLFRKKIIYIESFARVYDGTRAGKLMYKYADLFIYQWESLEKIYPKGVFGGSIY